VSGESLARELGVSRTAVWKYIRKLRQQGYQIISSPRVGYQLADSSDILLLEDIQKEVTGNWQVQLRAEVDSTQEVLRTLARKGAEEGLVLVAERQTLGRGRLGRKWLSPHGGIYFSILLRPAAPPWTLLRLPLIAGVAVAETVQEISTLQCTLKWPNDVFVRAKKLAGILCEIDAEVDMVNHVILGIGLNVNNEIAEELRQQATSMRQECGTSFSRAACLGQLLNRLETYYLAFRGGQVDPLLEKWRQLSSTLGSEVVVSSPGDCIEGKAVDIDKDGALLVRRASDDTLVRILAGDVSLKTISE